MSQEDTLLLPMKLRPPLRHGPEWTEEVGMAAESANPTIVLNNQHTWLDFRVYSKPFVKQFQLHLSGREC